MQRRGEPDGQIVVLGTDDVPLPSALAPSRSDVLVQADGSDRWLVIGQEPTDWAEFGAAVVRAAPGGSLGFRTQPAAPQLREFVRGWRLAGYHFGTAASPTKQLLLPPGSPDVGEVLRAVDATLAARDLVNTPSNVKNPEWMVGKARAMARRVGADVEVLGPARLRAGGFGGVLSVGAGSSSPPRLVSLHKPGTGPRVVLVGKGITYDSGGLSIKPRESMALMKTDMSGAAAVLSALKVAPEDMDVAVVLALAENAVGANSYRPGDVITHVDGRTTEVRNTDAEGRLVLADALAYARMTMSPDVMVDLATLTGAATVALSREMGALYASTRRLETSLLAAGRASGEHLWPMPLVESYRPALASDIADQCHIAVDGHIGAGSITAALFLRPFAGDVPWAHLDIAGPARATVAAGVKQVGGTGFGVALLGRWLQAGARY